MITLTRSQVRRLRAAFRRSILGISHRGIVSELVLRAEGSQLRAQHRYCDLAVECVETGNYRPVTSLAIPLDALADFEGAAETPVTLESAAPDRTVVRWEDRGIPQSREYSLITPVDRQEPMPALPTTWASNPAELLDALAEATETGTPDSTRYALDMHPAPGQPRPDRRHRRPATAGPLGLQLSLDRRPPDQGPPDLRLPGPAARSAGRGGPDRYASSSSASVPGPSPARSRRMSGSRPWSG